MPCVGHVSARRATQSNDRPWDRRRIIESACSIIIKHMLKCESWDGVCMSDDKNSHVHRNHVMHVYDCNMHVCLQCVTC